MSMDKLKLAIGLAPHEIPYDQLISNLMQERERINSVLLSSKPIKKTTKKITSERKPRSKKTLTRDQAADILKRLNL